MKDDGLARDVVEALRVMRRITEIVASNVAALGTSEAVAQELNEQAAKLARLEGRMTGKLNTH
jgi:hypothetical protein